MKRRSAAAGLLLLGLAGCRERPAPAVSFATPAPAERSQHVDTAREPDVMVSPLAGRWYPASAGDLRRALDGLIPDPRPDIASGVCAILVPHAGYAYSGKVAAQVYARLDSNAFTRVVILGPSHSVAMPNRLSIPPADAVETPLGRIAVDTAFVQQLRRSPQVIHDPRAHSREHSDQIQVPLVQTFVGRQVKLVPIVVGQMDRAGARAFAACLRPLLDNRTLVVVSSDFTHYGPNFGYVPFRRDVPKQIEALDHRVFSRIADHDAAGFWDVMEKTQATVCGHHPLAILMELLPPDAKVGEVAYDTSGRQLNDWENSVSYLGAIVVGTWRPAAADQPVRPETPSQPPDCLDPEDRAQLLALARATVESAARTGRLPELSAIGIELRPGVEKVMGGFVTLNKHHELRGCIGEIFPRRKLWQAVREQALNAALHDPRFSPVTTEELRDIAIEISALTPPHPVDSWRDIVIGRHGIVLEKNGHSAVFLPQVAPEQGWDLPTTLAYLSRKAGLPADAWKEGATFMVFEAQVFGE